MVSNSSCFFVVIVAVVLVVIIVVIGVSVEVAVIVVVVIVVNVIVVAVIVVVIGVSVEVAVIVVVVIVVNAIVVAVIIAVILQAVVAAALPCVPRYPPPPRSSFSTLASFLVKSWPARLCLDNAWAAAVSPRKGLLLEGSGDVECACRAWVSVVRLSLSHSPGLFSYRCSCWFYSRLPSLPFSSLIYLIFYGYGSVQEGPSFWEI